MFKENALQFADSQNKQWSHVLHVDQGNVFGIPTGYTLNGPQDRIQVGANFSHPSRPGVGPTHLYTVGNLSPLKTGYQGMALATHHHLVPRVEESKHSLLLLFCVFVAGCSVNFALPLPLP